MKITTTCIIWLAVALALPASVSGLTGQDAAALAKSGVSSQTMALIIREKVVETQTLTVPEIIGLKRAGISEESLQQIIEAMTSQNRRKPTVYGNAFDKQRRPSVEEIISLKEAGISDAVINALILRGEPERTDDQEDKAWRMLDNLNLEVEKP